MPERSHPERKVIPTLRFASELVIARTIIRESEEKAIVEKRIAEATQVWAENLDGYLVDVFDAEPECARTISDLFEADVAIGKLTSWKDGLGYAQREVPDDFFSNLETQVSGRPREGSPPPNGQSKPRSFEEVWEAQRLAARALDEASDKKERVLDALLNRPKLPKDFTPDELIDYQIALERSSSFISFEYALGRQHLPGREGEERELRRTLTLKGLLERDDSFLGLNLKIKTHKKHIVFVGYREALDFALGEEDDNNGLVRFLEQQRQNHPRA